MISYSLKFAGFISSYCTESQEENSALRGYDLALI